MPNRERLYNALAAALLIAMISYVFVGLVDQSRSRFAHEGHEYSYSISDLPTTVVQGRIVYSLSLGKLTPDQGVEVSFYPVSPSLIDYDMRVVASDGNMLRQQTGNTGYFARIYPERVVNLTFMIIPLCVECSLKGYEGGFYTYISIAPFFEFKVVAYACGAMALVAFLERLYLKERNQFSTRTFTYYLTIGAIFVGMSFFSWYAYAYGNQQWYFSTVLAVVTFLSGVVLAYLKPIERPNRTTKR
jgi:hypothetical protein